MSQDTESYWGIAGIASIPLGLLVWVAGGVFMRFLAFILIVSGVILAFRHFSDYFGNRKQERLEYEHRLEKEWAEREREKKALAAQAKVEEERRARQAAAAAAHAEHEKTPVGRIEKALIKLDLAADSYAGYEVQPKIVGITGDTRELIRRLQVKGTPQQALIAQTQYADILEKLVMCVSPDYLKDVIDNPRYWDHPEKRTTEVTAVLDVVPEQIAANIRQLNSATDLDFQTALAVLGNLSDEAEITALYQQAGQ